MFDTDWEKRRRSACWFSYFFVARLNVLFTCFYTVVRWWPMRCSALWQFASLFWNFHSQKTIEERYTRLSLGHLHFVITRHFSSRLCWLGLAAAKDPSVCCPRQDLVFAPRAQNTPQQMDQIPAEPKQSSADKRRQKNLRIVFHGNLIKQFNSIVMWECKKGESWCGL